MKRNSLWNSLWVKKSMHLSPKEGEGLKRHLNAIHLTAIGIGAIIGAGIFIITGQAAALFAGPAIVISFILGAIVCVLTGLCYAELSSLIPVAGGSYSYSYVAMGEFPAWIVAWALFAQYLGAIATVAAGWSGYFVSLLRDLGVKISPLISKAPLLYNEEMGWHLSGSYLNFPAVAILLVVTLFVAMGVKAVTRFNNLMLVMKLGAVALFILLGIFHINPENWVPFIPENTGVMGEFGISGILRGAGLVFFAYLGFDTVSTLAQDAVNPQRDLPRGILASLAICALAYVATSLVLTGVVNYKELNVASPMAVALNAMGPKFFVIGFVIQLAILAALASVLLIQTLGQTRILFAISEDGLLPPAFSRLHAKTKTPLFSTLMTGGISLALAALFPVDMLGQLVSMSTLLLFSIVCLAVLLLRKSHADQVRPFRVPFVPWIPLAAIVGCVTQMVSLSSNTWVQLIIWLAIGFCVYFFYGRRNSRLRIGNI